MKPVIVYLIAINQNTTAATIKRSLLYPVIILLLLSCSKNDSSSIQNALMAHTWVTDSVTFRNADLQPVIYHEPKDRIRFGTDKYYTSSGTGAVTNSAYYEVGGSGRLYMWGIDEEKDLNRYFLIDQLTGNQLVLGTRPPGTLHDYYYHAK